MAKHGVCPCNPRVDRGDEHVGSMRPSLPLPAANTNGRNTTWGQSVLALRNRNSYVRPL